MNPGADAPPRLGRYELLARIAQGGMGEIFLARLEGAAGFEKLFVVKRVLPHLADDPRFRGMLIAEARLSSRMSHANICQVYELGETDGQLYIVMEYLEGVTVLPLLRKASKEQSALDVGFVAGVVQQTTDALHYAHELRDRGGESLGIVHRDVTPSNIFLTDVGVVKVLDFGIAKVKDASAHTQTGTVKGKYAYMAPEQLRGAAVDRRADVFALGVVVYEMLALRRLFQRKTDYLTFRAVMEQPIADVRRYRPDAPAPLADALAKALERDPDKRWESSRAFGAAILDAIGRRAWTQGELGDFVRTQFADEIRERSAEVAVVAGAGPGRGVAQLSNPDDPSGEPFTEDDFPEVESIESPETRAARAGDFQQVTPPPFAGESSPSASPLPQATAPVVVVKRGLLWPLVAVAMLAVAGGALFLVWKQMQRQQAPAVVNITTEPDPRLLIDGGAVDAEPGSAAAVAPHVAPKKPPDDRAVIVAHKPDADRCVTQHGAPPPGTKVTIVIGADGKPKRVTVEAKGLAPAKTEATPLAACIEDVFARATFARGSERTLSVNLVSGA